MIEKGDRIAVGVSGGKDSLLLLNALALYRKFCKNPFELEAICLGLGYEPFDVSGVQALCDRLEVPFTYRKTDIKEVVFDIRKETNPCAMCAKLRRGPSITWPRNMAATRWPWVITGRTWWRPSS